MRIQSKLNSVMRSLGYRRVYRDGLYSMGASYHKNDTKFFIYAGYMSWTLELRRTLADKVISIKAFSTDDLVKDLPDAVLNIESMASQVWSK